MIIEWPERSHELIQPADIEISFDMTNEIDERSIDLLNQTNKLGNKIDFGQSRFIRDLLRIRTINKNRTLFLIIFTVLISNSVDAKALLKNIRISTESLETRLVIDVSQTINYKVFTLNRPNRVVIDLYQTEISPQLKSDLSLIHI